MRVSLRLPDPRPPLAWALLLAWSLVAPASAAPRPMTAAPDGERACDDEGGDDRYERHCEVREMKLPAGHVEVDAAPNGGIEVRGGKLSEIQIRARVVARARTVEEARALAAEVRIETAGVVRAVGPRPSRDRSYWVSYELLVPEATDLRLETMNGGIALHDLKGTVEFKTVNGGVTVDSAAGSVHGRTTNGGLDISLRGSSWDGEGLDVETTNGGVKVRVPSDYSARLVTGTVNGGMSFDFPVTVQGRINKRLDVTLGRGGPTVRAVTTNGGVTVGRR
jgi:Toastrack DUF4097